MAHTCFLKADEVLSCFHWILLKQSGPGFPVSGGRAVKKEKGDIKCKNNNTQAIFFFLCSCNWINMDKT